MPIGLPSQPLSRIVWPTSMNKDSTCLPIEPREIDDLRLRTEFGRAAAANLETVRRATHSVASQRSPGPVTASGVAGRRPACRACDHCVARAGLKVFWRHHSDYCGQRLRTPRNQNWQPGARFVAGNLDNDFTLLELTRPVLASSTYRQHFAGWSRDLR